MVRCCNIRKDGNLNCVRVAWRLLARTRAVCLLVRTALCKAAVKHQEKTAEGTGDGDAFSSQTVDVVRTPGDAPGTLEQCGPCLPCFNGVALLHRRRETTEQAWTGGRLWFSSWRVAAFGHWAAYCSRQTWGWKTWWRSRTRLRVRLAGERDLSPLFRVRSAGFSRALLVPFFFALHTSLISTCTFAGCVDCSSPSPLRRAFRAAYAAPLRAAFCALPSAARATALALLRCCAASPASGGNGDAFFRTDILGRAWRGCRRDIRRTGRTGLSRRVGRRRDAAVLRSFRCRLHHHYRRRANATT